MTDDEVLVHVERCGGTARFHRDALPYRNSRERRRSFIGPRVPAPTVGQLRRLHKEGRLTGRTVTVDSWKGDGQSGVWFEVSTP